MITPRHLWREASCLLSSSYLQLSSLLAIQCAFPLSLNISTLQPLQLAYH